MRGKPVAGKLAYIRALPAAKVGAGDSDKRHRAASEGYARRAGFELVGEFTDAAPVPLLGFRQTITAISATI